MVCFVFCFSFKHPHLSVNHHRLCEVFVYVLVSVQETLAETDDKGSKSVCKIVCLFATVILGYGQNSMPVFVVVCKGEKYGN